MMLLSAFTMGGGAAVSNGGSKPHCLAAGPPHGESARPKLTQCSEFFHVNISLNADKMIKAVLG